MKERVLTATGEKGTFEADMLSGHLVFFENGRSSVDWEELGPFRGVTEGDVVRYAITKREPLRRELQGFRNLVLHDRGERIFFAEAEATVEVAERVPAAAHH